MLLTIIFSFCAVLLLIISLCGLMSINSKNMLAIGLFWLFSWLAQIFAAQLAVICVFLAFAAVACTAPLWIAPVALAAAALHLINYCRGLRTATVANQVIDKAINALELSPVNKQQIPPAQKINFGAGLRPFHFKRAQVTRVKNIPYDDASENQLLDIYQPAVKPAGQLSPLLIQIPGGAWVTGSKNEQGLPLMYQMASRGWTCVAINYRLAPRSRFPAMLEDVLRAVAWIKSHASEYGIEPDYAVITGGSAGGHLATLATLIDDDQRAQLLGDRATVDTRVNLALPIYGRYDFLNRHHILPGDGLEPFLTSKVMPGSITQCPALWELASPESQVHKNAPPFLIVHGSADTMIPAAETRAFVSALKQSSTQAVDYLELPGAEHGFDMLSASWALPTLQALGRFLQAHYLQYQQNTSQRESSSPPQQP
jgi:acetyl esterase/lipase